MWTKFIQFLVELIDQYLGSNIICKTLQDLLGTPTQSLDDKLATSIGIYKLKW